MTAYAREGNGDAFAFTKPVIGELDYSFSGLKTAFLYFIRDRLKENKDFIQQNRNDLCASIQKTIVEILTDKLEKAYLQTGINEIALAGGVSANSGLRERIRSLAKKHGWKVFIPEIRLTTDNAAMIASDRILQVPGRRICRIRQFAPCKIADLRPGCPGWKGVSLFLKKYYI